ncbi:VgrG-related protein [Actinomycetospora termitidis]|uniref:VgrG-related protein n=1 Tax=Actinomycetospora termitidis TaxID=3053470 RepID=A0ABT7M961_9PSEU|nr:VgrG-related protein [Actinomycetospora sp. Odt1-22]MDL5156567.1 VgrG-related protein [Actinomycetospora sp. Odt1-22]
MSNEQITSTLLVEVDGADLRPEVAVRMTYAYVDDSRLLPDLFVLRFRDPDRTVLAAGRFRVGAAVRLRVRTSDAAAPQLLLSGEVTALGAEIDDGGSVTEVRGYDHAHRLYRGRRVEAYANMSVSDVVRTVAQRAGLRVGQVDGLTSPPPDTQITQDNVSDGEFLRRLADTAGTEVSVVDRTLSFCRPTAATAAAGAGTRALRDPQVLEAGRNLTVLHASVSSAEQVDEVEVRGWDPLAKRAVTATAPARATTAATGADPQELAREFGHGTVVATDVPYRTQDGVRTAARALAEQIAGAATELDGVARGNPALRAGSAVSLAGVGAPFEGTYTLTTTRHLFSDDVGYSTAFTASGGQERSLYGLTTGGRERAAPGLVPGVVTDVRDPRRIGRVKLAFPWLGEHYSSGWARTVQLGAGKERGAMILPEVGDEVLVGFEQGDLDSPYVLGGLYNGQDAPASCGYEPVDRSTGRVGGRRLVSRTGHRLDLVETADRSAVELATDDDHQVLTLDRTGDEITLSSSGTVRIAARRGITVDAGTGTLALKGAQVTVNGTTSVEVEGPRVKVGGTASAELTATGPVSVQGTPVRIN